MTDLKGFEMAAISNTARHLRLTVCVRLLCLLLAAAALACAEPAMEEPVSAPAAQNNVSDVEKPAAPTHTPDLTRETNNSSAQSTAVLSTSVSSKPGSDEPIPTPTLQPAYTPILTEPVSSPTVIPTSTISPTAEPASVTASPAYVPDIGYSTVDERILRSDVIARATMRSVSAHALYSPYYRGYYGIIRFKFDVHEYLKGDGDDVLYADVLLPSFPRPDNAQEAVAEANRWITAPDVYDHINPRWWEERESIIFLLMSDRRGLSELEGLTRTNHYKFLHQGYSSEDRYWENYAHASGGHINGEYSVESERNRVWLPSSAASGVQQAASGEQSFMLGDAPAGVSDTRVSTASSDANISLSGLKVKIKAMDKLLKDNADVAGFEECLIARFHDTRTSNYDAETSPAEFAIESGLSVGNIFYDHGMRGEGYDPHHLIGEDTHLFEMVTEDEDNNPRNGYRIEARNKRPVVRGQYKVSWQNVLYEWIPCGYKTPPRPWLIKVTAPDGTLHEAFFDPVELGGAVGADGTDGVLKPAAFSANGSDDATTIERIGWQSNAVSIAISDAPSLANHHIDFIALDGSVALRLDFDDASGSDEGSTRTMIWKVCEQPWQAGDLLMLRISESEEDLTGVTNDTACDGDPTATPTPKPMPTGR